jgi:hypothetical protein
MGVRRQIYLADADDRLLRDRSQSTGISVSELIRRAVQQCYGARRRLSWEDIFTLAIPANAGRGEAWTYDALLDPEPGDLTRSIDGET